MNNFFKKAAVLFLFALAFVGVSKADAATFISGFNPSSPSLNPSADITGTGITPKLWLDATDKTTLFSDIACNTAASEGGSVGCWQDKIRGTRFGAVTSTNGAQVALAGKPTLLDPNTALSGTTAEKSGKTTVSFPGTVGTYLSQLNTSGTRSDFTFFGNNTTKSTVFFVGNRNAQSGSYQILFSTYQGGSGPTTVGVSHGVLRDTSDIKKAATYSGLAGPGFGSFISNDTPLLPTGYLGHDFYTTTVFTPSTVKASTQSGIFKSPNTFTPLSELAEYDLRARLGMGNTGVASGYFNGEIAEAIMYEGELSDAQINSVECYLSRKWKVESTICDDIAPTATAGPVTPTNASITFTVVDDDHFDSSTTNFDAKGSGIKASSDISVVDTNTSGTPDTLSVSCSTLPSTGNTSVSCSVTGFTVQGSHTVTITPTDARGNTGLPVTMTFVFDNQALAPVINTPSNGNPVSGTGEVGAVVTVTSDPAGSTCTATVASNGTWSCALSPLPTSGTYSATQTDPLGNISSVSDIGTIESSIASVVNPQTVSPASGSSYPVTITFSCVPGTTLVQNGTAPVLDLASTCPLNGSSSATVTGPGTVAITVGIGLTATGDFTAHQETRTSTSTGSIRYCTSTITTNCRQKEGMVAVVTAQTPVVPTSCSLSYFTETMKKGSSGTQTINLQKFLNNFAKTSIKVDNIYGPQTTAAVRAFQSTRLIKVDNIVGPITRGEIHKAMCEKGITIDQIK